MSEGGLGRRAWLTAGASLGASLSATLWGDARAATGSNAGDAPLVAREDTDVRVLMYHSFGQSRVRRAVTAKLLELQLQWLQAHETPVVRFREVVEFLRGERRLPRRAVAITIDDGERNGFTVAYPLLRKYRAPFTIGLPTIVAEHPQDHGGMGWAELREMVDSGWCDVASHGHTHRSFRALSDTQLRDELRRSRELIGEHTGEAPRSVFYPLGSYDERVRRFVREAGYDAACIAFGAPVNHRTQLDRIHRYNVDGSTGTWLLQRLLERQS